jgi:glycosyltransferase involved in cell wall biosynthesis
MPEKPIVILSDSLRGGAAHATTHLAEGLAAAGTPLERWHFSSNQRDTAICEFSLDPEQKRPPFERILKNFFRDAANRLRKKRHHAALRNRIAQTQPPLLNVHNIHDSGLDHDALPADLPLIWTLHDCWAFAAEAYTWQDTHLGATQTAAGDRPQEAALARRKSFFARSAPTALVAPSQWLANTARQHTPSHVTIKHIPYGIDLDAFTRHDPAASQQALGLDPDRIWLGHAATWANSRKGFDIIAATLRQMDCSGLGLLIWGQQPDDPLPANLPVHYSGHISGTDALSRHYSASNLFLCPSRADNLPNTVLESLACGTPILGSEVGGIPDMVRPGQTGWLFPGDTPAACAQALQSALAERPTWPTLQTQCREIAEAEYSLSLQATRYQQLIAELCSE